MSHQGAIRSAFLAAALATAVTTTSCAHQPMSAESDSDSSSLRAWKTPPGWRAETIPFPLPFAQDLHHQGLEELRFAPGFFDPSAPGYFSYAMIWWLRDREPLTAEQLSLELLHYYQGLCNAVRTSQLTPQQPFFSAHLSPTDTDFPGWDSMSGEAHLYDAFKTGQPLTLQLRVYQRECGPSTDQDMTLHTQKQPHRAIILLASPQPTRAQIWTELLLRRDQFSCN
ncbi:MAG TPA: hypothetical protein PLA87_24215 [Pseudomonadota bacterium]|nr:hypothetical protein [Pseudomonadota bacterium]